MSVTSNEDVVKTGSKQLLLPGMIRRLESDVPMDELATIPSPSATPSQKNEGEEEPVQVRVDGVDSTHTTMQDGSSMLYKRGSLTAGRLHRSMDDDDDETKPSFGRLESSPTRENSDAGGMLAEFAKGNKSINSIARYDVKNAWLVSFSISIFVEMFIYHALGPLAIPIITWRYGFVAVKNMALHKFSPPAGLGNVMWAFWIIQLVLYGCLDTPHVTFTEVFLTACIFLARNTIIAAKYAYFSPKQLADLIKREFTAEEQGRFLITSGWYYPNALTLKYELEYAVKRTKIDLRHMEFTFAGDDETERIEIAKRLHASFDESLKLENRCDHFDPSWPIKLSEGIVPGQLLVNGLLNESVSATYGTPWIKYALAIGVLHGLIPSIIRVSSEPNTIFGRSAPEVCIVVMCFCVSFFNVFANLAFVLTGKIDFDRRVYLMHQCSAMLSVQYKIHQSGKSQLLPLLNVDAAKNIASWLDLRLLLKDFGQQYSHRIQAYASLWLFFVILFLAYLFSQLVLKTSETTSIVLVIFDLVVVMSCLVLMILSAKTLNTVHLEHRRILLHQLNLLQRQISYAVSVSPTGLELDLTPRRIKELRETREMIDVALQVLDHEDAVAPVRILGFDASENFLRVILGVSGSAGIAAVKLILDL